MAPEPDPAAPGAESEMRIGVQLIYERIERAEARKGCPKGVTLA